MAASNVQPVLLPPRVHNSPECATPIQLCVGSWSSGIGSSDVMRTLHTSARPVSRQGTIVFDPRVPATPRVPLRCVRYYDAKIRFRSTKTLCRAGSGVAHSGGLCTLAATCIHCHTEPCKTKFRQISAATNFQSNMNRRK